MTSIGGLDRKLVEALEAVTPLAAQAVLEGALWDVDPDPRDEAMTLLWNRYVDGPALDKRQRAFYDAIKKQLGQDVAHEFDDWAGTHAVDNQRAGMIFGLAIGLRLNLSVADLKALKAKSGVSARSRPRGARPVGGPGSRICTSTISGASSGVGSWRAGPGSTMSASSWGTRRSAPRHAICTRHRSGWNRRLPGWMAHRRKKGPQKGHTTGRRRKARRRRLALTW